MAPGEELTEVAVTPYTGGLQLYGDAAASWAAREDLTLATNRPGQGPRDGTGLSGAKGSFGPGRGHSAPRSCHPWGGGAAHCAEAECKEELLHWWKSVHFTPEP